MAMCTKRMKWRKKLETETDFCEWNFWRCESMLNALWIFTFLLVVTHKPSCCVFGLWNLMIELRLGTHSFTAEVCGGCWPLQYWECVAFVRLKLHKLDSDKLKQSKLGIGPNCIHRLSTLMFTVRFRRQPHNYFFWIILTGCRYVRQCADDLIQC